MQQRCVWAVLAMTACALPVSAGGCSKRAPRGRSSSARSWISKGMPPLTERVELSGSRVKQVRTDKLGEAVQLLTGTDCVGLDARQAAELLEGAPEVEGALAPFLVRAIQGPHGEGRLIVSTIGDDLCVDCIFPQDPRRSELVRRPLVVLLRRKPSKVYVRVGVTPGRNGYVTRDRR